MVTYLVNLLKDDANILVRSIFKLVMSLSNSIRSLKSVKLHKSNCFLKKVPILTLKTTDPFHYSPFYRKLLKGLLMIKHKNIWGKTKFFIDLETTKKIIPTDKITTGFDKGLFTGTILIDLQKAFDTIDKKRNT